MGNYGNPMKVMVVTGNYGNPVKAMSVTGNYGNPTQAMQVSGNYGCDMEIMLVSGNYGYDMEIMLVSCFPKSELVNTGYNTHVPIGSLKVGDKISSWDTELKKEKCTAVTGIHKYTVTEIMCFNNAMRVSSSHPLMVMESNDNGILIPKWKVAIEVNVGDCVVGAGGKLKTIETKSRHWYDTGIEVLNLETDSGVPFLVGNFVVKAENAQDNIEWADSPVTQKLIA